MREYDSDGTTRFGVITFHLLLLLQISNRLENSQ